MKGAFRPEELVIVNGAGPNSQADGVENSFEVEIAEKEFLGSYVRLYLRSAELGDHQLRADIARTLVRAQSLEPAEIIRVRIPPERIRLYEGEGE